MTSLTLRDAIVAALEPLDAQVVVGEPTSDEGGAISRGLVVSIDSGVVVGRRMSGYGPGVSHLVNILVVSTSKDSCVHLAEQARNTLDGLSAHPNGLVTDESYTGDPLPEPSVHPARWSKTLAFGWTTNRSA